MKTVVNEPLAKTFGWLRVNGTEVDAPENAEKLSLSLSENEERTVAVENAAQIEAKLAKGATLKLIQLRRGGDETLVSDIRVNCAEGARFEWYRVVLGGAASYDNCSVELAGDGSSFAAELGYRLGGKEKLDVNCEAIHLGKRTKSAIHSSGVLAGESFKLMRGTIDFRTGCSGSSGNETEDVLLLDDTVRNQSVPVILCAEEDVAGDHGATIGRLDEQLVYYLEARGIEHSYVYEMMAKAKLDAVIRKLPDEKLRRELLGEEEANELD